MVKNGITLLSAHDPKGMCCKIVSAVEIKDRTLYFCPSPIYGYGIDTLLMRLQNEAPDSAVLCVEADSELWEKGEGRREKGEGKREKGTGKILYTNICEPERLCDLVREHWGSRAFRRVEVLRLTGGWRLYPELYASLCETLRREIANEWSNALTLTKLGRLYIRNFLWNLTLIERYPSIGELSFGDSPVLVLGAGPSLDEALETAPAGCALPRNRDFKIVCVDTCLGALKDRGIVPDLVVILESQHWNLRDFTGCRGWNVPFAFDMSALPGSARALAGEGYLFFTPWTELAVFDRMKKANLLPETIPPLGSVGLAAMEIASRLTTGKITTAGLDFCFNLDKSHARGTPAHRNKLNNHNRFGGLLNTGVFREGVIKEQDRYTNPIMKRYKELFEKRFSENYSHGGHRCTEITEKNLSVFIQSEIDRLIELRDILMGKNTCYLLPATCYLLKECNYLYAHFPDYAGGVEPDINDTSFLKRVRVEIDFMLKIIHNL